MLVNNINLDVVTVDDCLDAYERRGITAIINDGKLLGFNEKED